MKSIAVLLILAAGLVQQPSLSEREILEQAEARIQKYRTGDVRLRLLGPNGAPLKPGARIRIEQTRHQFLFGSNIFKLGTCRTPADNEAYGQRFAELFNFATLPFYWWMYEPVRGESGGHARNPRSVKAVRPVFTDSSAPTRLPPKTAASRCRVSSPSTKAPVHP